MTVTGEARNLEMRFAGALVQHLGLQMYSGAVPAIAELVANAWDADAPEVTITVPFDQAITDDLEIRVQDSGRGMLFEDVNDHYLVIGRNRRLSEGNLSLGGRRVLGRKGIGKLAGFGIALEVEVWTARDGRLTGFSMRYEDITRHGEAGFVESYQPPVLADRAITDDDELRQGTLIVLKHLQLKNAINGNRFRQSMVRRFSLLSADFRVVVNGVPLARDEMDLQFRFPNAGWNDAEVPGVGSVRWWAGFTKLPIPVEESRGIAVLVRGKLAQAPFYFEMSGGTSGQHGLQYLTGEVLADSLDDEADLIATDRASVLWEHPSATPLLEWGQQTVRELLRRWALARSEAHTTRLRDTTQFLAMVERFPEREREELTAAIEKLASIDTIEDDRLEELVDILIRAYENDYFMSVIRALNAAGVQAHEELASLIKEWDVIEAITTAQKVRGRVELIRKFRQMIQERVPEKPDMQDFVKEHPWLLDTAWELLLHERSLDRVVAEHFRIDIPDEQEERTGARRLDFFCLGDTSLAVVVELKRPGDLIGRDELRQLEDYVDFLRERNTQSTGSQRVRSRITGCLVYSRMRTETTELIERLERSGMYIVTWDQLLENAERLHREFMDIAKSRAPQDDPRVQAIPPIEDEADDPVPAPD